MFQTPSHINKRTGNNHVHRFEYLQRLTTEFQTKEGQGGSEETESRFEVLVHLSNFCYDPINFPFLRALNVIPDLLLDSLEDPHLPLVCFALLLLFRCLFDH